jgi:hypothetical protein
VRWKARHSIYLSDERTGGGGLRAKTDEVVSFSTFRALSHVLQLSFILHQCGPVHSFKFQSPFPVLREKYAQFVHFIHVKFTISRESIIQ